MIRPSSEFAWTDIMPSYHSRVAVTSRLRLREHDYTSSASYSITICTRRHVCLFGTIRDGIMHHAPAGVVMDSWWHSIPRQFPSVELDTMVIMPNHLHGIIHVGTDPNIAPPSLGTIMHWFKSRSTYDYILGVELEGWPRFPGKLWQGTYYEHIIRNDRALDRIRDYIDANPWMWARDTYYRPTDEETG